MKQIQLILLAVFSLQFLSAQNITRLEYFFNADKGVGMNTIIPATVSQDGSIAFAANLNAVPAGSQILFIRTQDDNGNWSQTIRKRIQVQPGEGDPVNLQLEYFYDQDPGFGKGEKIEYLPSAASNAISFTAMTNNVGPGVHSLYLRTLDNYGRWSQTTRRVIEVLPSEQVRQIIAGEYFFDVDPGVGAARRLEITNKDSVINQSFNLNLAGISAGPHAMFIRYLDNNGKWGQTTRRTIDVSAVTDSNAVVSLEYSVNKDAGVGLGKVLQIPVPFQNGSFSFTLPPGEFRAGLDTFYLRVKDRSGIFWSHTQFRTALVPPEIILPLTLLDFTGSRNQDQVNLRWKTSNEVNTSSFSIERSLDGMLFKEVGELPARSMTTAAEYAYLDNVAAITASRIFYRLRQVDNNGSFTFSKVISVSGLETVNRFTISPNPAQSFVDLKLTGPRVSSTITVSDFSGRRLITKALGTTDLYRLDLSSLPSGTFNITLSNQFGITTQKLVKK
jgi:hypothetical protein